MTKFQKILRHHLFQGSILILAANMIANAGNYFFHLFTGRFLTPQQYGLLQSLIALSYFLGVFSNAFSFSVIQFINQLKEPEVCFRVRWLEKRALELSFFLWLIFLLLFPFFKNLLHLTSISPYFIFSLPLLFYLLPPLYQSVLRARLLFARFSFLTILSTFAKTISALTLILLGCQLKGALWSFTIASILTIICGGYWVSRPCWGLTKGSSKGPSFSSRRFWNFSFLSLITNLSLNSLYSSDVILSRYYLSEFEAGLYAAVSVLGKIIFFASTAVLLVSYPLFVQEKRNLKRLRQIFWLSFFFISFICLFSSISYHLFPKMIVTVLYGSSYSQAVFLLAPFALFMSLLAIFNLFIQLLLCLENKLAGWLAGFTAVFQIVLIHQRHLNLQMIINNSLASLGLGLLFSFIFVKKILDGRKQS